MFLKKLVIQNFRAIDYLELDFNKGLNIIIGENNAGKTAVIDALRLSLGDFKQPEIFTVNGLIFELIEMKYLMKLKILNLTFSLNVKKKLKLHGLMSYIQLMKMGEIVYNYT